IAGDNGLLYRTGDQGVSWVQQAIPTSEEIIQVKMFNDSLGYLETANHNIFKKGASPTLLKEIENGKTSFSLFPNPASDKVTILSENTSTVINVKICDTFGKIVYKHKGANEIDIRDLKNGIYNVLIDDSFNFERKMLVKVE
ncbi:MAG TPA: T9SS type A sorting domain-containing protein, partial [Bacteroidia bacterium]|nr:T9SS type A sorting domain-containing protein [Bacteroidia bacterium]